MSQGDVKFADAAGIALRLRARDADDLKVISTLLQDAVFVGSDVSWDERRREYAVLLSRFRWEAKKKSELAAGTYERVRTVLSIRDVLSISEPPPATEEPPDALSLLSISFEPGEDGTGTMKIFVSGGFDTKMDVECIDVSLTDVSDPWNAVSGIAPDHG